MKRQLLINRPFKYRYFYATFILIAVNALVFALSFFFKNLDIYLGLSVVGCIKYHFWWQPFTYMFVHANWEHLLFNMLGVLFFGMAVERTCGSWEFLVFYIVCGIFDGLVSLLVYYLTGTRVLLVGASGAIYSILLFYATLYPRSIISIWGIIPVPAPLLVLLYAVIEIVSQLVGSSNVAHLTHLAGFVMAYLYIVVRMRINPVKVWINAYRK